MRTDKSERRTRDGLAVLVVEDDFFIAHDLRLILEEAGYRVVGPASTVTQALHLLSVEPVHVAVLDVNLNGHKVTPVAAVLRRQAVPYVLASANESDYIDQIEELRGAQNVGKPVSERKLLAAVAQAADDRDSFVPSSSGRLGAYAIS